MKIPFSPPYIDDTVIGEVVDSLRSGWTSGPKVKALEEEIKLFQCKRSAVCELVDIGSYHDASLAGCSFWDEVIVPAYTYSATALAVPSTLVQNRLWWTERL